MQNAGQRLLDVLKDTLKHQEQVCGQLEKHKQLLIAGKDVEADPVLQEIEQHCSAVARNEQTRQTIVAEIAVMAGLEAESLTADNLLKLPLLLSIREELSQLTIRLRKVIRQIIRLRDDIQVLAQHAEAYTQMFMEAISQSTKSPHAYGSVPMLNSRFISVRT